MSVPATESTTALQRARALIDLRRYPEAAKLASQVISTDPHNATAWCLMAQALLGQGQDSAGLEAARAAISQAPEEEWPQRLASIALNRMRRGEEAVQAAEEALRIAPHSWLTHVQLAGTLTDLKTRPADAKAAADRALELAPDQAGAHLMAGHVAAASGRKAEAAIAFRHALAIDPQNSAAHNELARLNLNRHSSSSLAKAATGFATAVAADPRSAVSRRNLDVVMRRFMSWIAYLVFLDAFLLARATASSGQFTARIAPIAILAIPAAYAARFIVRLQPHLRRYLAGLLVSSPVFRTAATLEALAVCFLLAGGAASNGIRHELAVIAAVAALGARLLLYAVRHQAARRVKSSGAAGLSHRTLTILAAALAIGALLSLVDAVTTTAQVVSAVWAVMFTIASALVARIIIRRRRAPHTNSQ